MDVVLESLHKAIPKMAFYKSRDLGNSRYNQALLTAMYEKYQLKPKQAAQDCVSWVNRVLKYQNFTNRIATGLQDLYDGELLSAVLATIEGNKKLHKEFLQSRENGKHISYLLMKLNEYGVPPYAQPTDF